MDLSRRFYSITIIVFLLAVLLALYLSKEFLMSLLLSIFIAYILHPVYAYLIQITGQRRTSSALSLAAVFIFLAIVILIVFVTVLNETTRLLESGSAIIQHVGKISDELTAFGDKYLPDPAANYLGHIPSIALDWVLLVLSAWLSAFVGSAHIIFTHLVLITFFTYYILVDGRRLLKRTIDFLPEKIIIKKFIHHLDDIYNNLFHVFLITAAITGTMATLGFFVLGVPYPLLWGMLVGLLELVPFLGSAAIVWPMAIYYALTGNYTMAVALAVLATIFLSVIPENVIRPRLALKGARVHPVITILAFTAPLFVIGAYGVILGPAVFGFVLAGYRTLSYMEKI
jgi:predicted PurR-regulated permease PerM